VGDYPVSESFNFNCPRDIQTASVLLVVLVLDVTILGAGELGENGTLPLCAGEDDPALGSEEDAGDVGVDVAVRGTTLADSFDCRQLVSGDPFCHECLRSDELEGDTMGTAISVAPTG
jgi:hypothetical protein